MAVVQNPLIGRAKQSVAGTTFSTWKGINVLRSKPIEVANPRSPGQLLQREKLSLTVALYRLMPGIIQTGYRQQAVKQSEYNAFTSDTLRNSFQNDTAETVFLDLGAISISKGTMQPTPISAATVDSDDMDITWDETAPLGPGQSSTDLAYGVVITNDVSDVVSEVFIAVAPVERSVGEIVVPDAGSASFNERYSFLFFASQVDNGVSDSNVVS